MIRQPVQLRPAICATCRLRACIAGLRDQRARGFGTSVGLGNNSSVGSSQWIEEQRQHGIGSGNRWRGSGRVHGLRDRGQMQGIRRAFSSGMAHAKPRKAPSSRRSQEQQELVDANQAILLDKRDDGVWELDEDLIEDVDPKRPKEPEFMTTADLNEDMELLEDMRNAQMGYALQAQDDAAAQQDPTQRTHPLTVANRFGTFPSTIRLPSETLVKPIATLLADVNNTHLKEAAYNVFGGKGLPYSTATPELAKTLQQKPIALDAAQSKMSETEGNLFIAMIMPGMYASVMSVLVETRKRLGTAWAEDLVQKATKGELRILDAGGAGAGVLAVREMLRAEWERMHEENSIDASGVALAEADGKLGGAGASPPLGSATVLTASDSLRRKVSRLLENTTFVPRLPDYLHTEEAKKAGKFDLVISPHTLWPLREDYIRKAAMDNLWSMTSIDGGVLLVLEKGNARGFEVVAGAREFLLSNRIAPPPSASGSKEDGAKGEEDVDDFDPKRRTEAGSIIAPCTNHSSCPLYKPQGMLKGRPDICHFSQRYVRAPIQQRILSASHKNFEDVKFSYFSVQRGRDIRSEKGISQNVEATDAAFEGYEQSSGINEEVSSLSLPRSILRPLKRRGHVTIDLCTPSGTLERWTVPRSFSKQAYRDARKSEWGDLWALGAKTRVLRTPRMAKKRGGASAAAEDVDAVTGEGSVSCARKGTKRERAALKSQLVAEANDGEEEAVVDVDEDEDGDEVEVDWEEVEEDDELDDEAAGEISALAPSGARGQGSQTRRTKIKGIRDKRDKKGDGRGRRKGAGFSRRP